MLQTHATPTGRRKTTLAMLSARAVRPSCYDPTKPGIVLAAFKKAADVLGCSARGVQYVDVLIGFTQAADWARGGKIACWPSAALLADTLNIGPSRLKELNRELQELGLLEIHDSPTGKRYGQRDAAGVVTVFYGFDLSPLACRLPEFQRIAAERRSNWQRGGELRAQVSALRKAILSLADTGHEEGIAGDWPGIAAEARRIADLKGRSYDPALLAPIAAELDELHQGTIEALTPVETVNSDPVEPENRPLITTTKHPLIAKANTRADGPSRPGVDILRERGESVRITRNDQRTARVESGKRERRDESPLRGFVASPAFVVQIAPAFARWTNKATPSFNDLLDASQLVRSELGISNHAWGQACVVLGRVEAVVTLAAIAARHEAGEVASPGGMLRRMVELHQSGELRLDRTLFGLADKLKARMH